MRVLLFAVLLAVVVACGGGSGTTPRDVDATVEAAVAATQIAQQETVADTGQTDSIAPAPTQSVEDYRSGMAEISSELVDAMSEWGQLFGDPAPGSPTWRSNVLQIGRRFSELRAEVAGLAPPEVYRNVQTALLVAFDQYVLSADLTAKALVAYEEGAESLAAQYLSDAAKEMAAAGPYLSKAADGAKLPTHTGNGGSSGSSSGSETTVKEFTGSGAQTTRPFTVYDGWEIRWDASGDVFQIYVYTGGGDLSGVAANQMGTGSGAAFQPNGGSYYLQMNAIGNWTVRVVQLP